MNFAAFGITADAIAPETHWKPMTVRANRQRKMHLSTRFGAHGKSVQGCRVEKRVCGPKDTNATRKLLIQHLLLNVPEKTRGGCKTLENAFETPPCPFIFVHLYPIERDLGGI
jgi:hypothetical protein